jgi:hypothetical protein
MMGTPCDRAEMGTVACVCFMMILVACCEPPGLPSRLPEDSFLRGPVLSCWGANPDSLGTALVRFTADVVAASRAPGLGAAFVARGVVGPLTGSELVAIPAQGQQ